MYDFGGSGFQGQVTTDATDDPCLDVFVNSCRETGTVRHAAAFSRALRQDPPKATKLMYHLRDYRNGRGEKDLTIACLEHLRDARPDLYLLNLEKLVVGYGCYRDLSVLYSRDRAGRGGRADPLPLQIFARGLMRSDPMACKWAPTEGHMFDRPEHGRQAYRIRGLLGWTWKEYRSAVSRGREAAGVVETSMCAGRWQTIDFSRVGRVAMKNYARSFMRNCAPFFSLWKESRLGGVCDWGPHAVVSRLRAGPDEERADMLSDAWDEAIGRLRNQRTLPRRGLAVVDLVSPSMEEEAGRCFCNKIDVAVAMAIVTASLGPDGFFADKVVALSGDSPRIVRLGAGARLGQKLEAVERARRPSLAGGSSLAENLRGAIRETVAEALLAEVEPAEFPSSIVIFSDATPDTRDSRHPDLFEGTPFTPPVVVFWSVGGAPAPGTPPINRIGEGTYSIGGYSDDLFRTYVGWDAGKPLGVGDLMDAALQRYSPVLE